MMSFMTLFRPPVQRENISLLTMNGIDACKKRNSFKQIISFDSFSLSFFSTILLRIQMIYSIDTLMTSLMTVNDDFNKTFILMLLHQIKYKVSLSMKLMHFSIVQARL